jgi:DNA-binding CsgD family transcriptional regulator/tetratricopeptide (TPR) repeat protein
VPTDQQLVGRDSELSTIAGALNDPGSGGVALVGPAGVGKSALARRAAELARERGLSTSVVRATSSASQVPFAALSPLLALLDVPLEGERTIFRAVNQVLTARGDGRLVVVVDDAHELDDASVALLDQMVDTEAIFVILTVRLGAPSGTGTLDMWKDLRVKRVQVDPLPAAAMREIAALNLGGPVEAATLRLLVKASAGNVLFLRELIQGALESGVLKSRYGLWRLEGSLASSARLRDLIEARLAGLDHEDRTALELMAIGEPLPLSVIESIVSVSAVERLEERSLIEAGTEGVEPELRLAHPLYGELVRDTLPPVRRARLSRALADAVEGAGDVVGADVLRVAVWRLDGGGGRPDFIASAARSAFRADDYRLAERLGRAGWEMWQRADAALVLGEALDLLGRASEADVILADAAPHAATDQERTSLAVRRASLLFRTLDRALDAQKVIEEATAAVRDPACLRELHALEGDHLLLSGDVARAIEIDQPLLSGPADGAFAQASLDVGTALALAGRTAEAIDHTSAALAVRLDLDDELQLSRTGVYVVAHTLALAYAGRIEEAAAMAEAGYEVAVERGIVDGQAWLGSVLGITRLMQGRLVRAVNLFREVAGLFAQLNHPGQRWGLAGIALAAGQMGDRATSQAAVTELVAMPLPSVRLMDVNVLRGQAWAHVATGDMTTARETLWEAKHLAGKWGQLAGAADALFDLVRIGERDAIDELRGLAGQVDGTLMAARITHAEAVAEQDPVLAGQAAEQFESIGALLLAAESAALDHRLSRGRGLQRRASASSATAERLAARCEGANTPALSLAQDVERLSSREHEVALLAANGLTSRAIAERLYVSKRTVDNHLQRIYTKLGVAGRHQLAERLRDSGELPGSAGPS